MYSYKEFYDGCVRIFDVVEDSDREAIQQQLMENYPECWYEPETYPWGDTVYVWLYDDTDEVERQVMINPLHWVEVKDSEFTAEEE